MTTVRAGGGQSRCQEKKTLTLSPTTSPGIHEYETETKKQTSKQK